MTQLIFVLLIRWTAIYPVDTAIQLLNNRGLGEKREILGALTICMKNPEIPGRIQMGRLFPVEILRKKVIPFEVFPFSCFYRNDRDFPYHLSRITSARLHVERKRKIYRYFVNCTTQSRSCFRCQKMSVPFDGNFSPTFPYKW